MAKKQKPKMKLTKKALKQISGGRGELAPTTRGGRRGRGREPVGPQRAAFGRRQR